MLNEREISGLKVDYFYTRFYTRFSFLLTIHYIRKSRIYFVVNSLLNNHDFMAKHFFSKIYQTNIAEQVYQLSLNCGFVALVYVSKIHN